jgi:hypothetical protein
MGFTVYWKLHHRQNPKQIQSKLLTSNDDLLNQGKFHRMIPVALENLVANLQILSWREEMKLLLWFGCFTLMLSGCGATLQWVKPGATEFDLRKAIKECDKEVIRDRLAIEKSNTMGPDDVTVTPQRRYRRGAGEVMRDQCLESRGWTLEMVE